MKKYLIIFLVVVLAIMVVPFTARASVIDDLMKIIINLQTQLINLLSQRGTVATTTPIGGGVACTMEVKQCPDGSYVGRSGPKCEFKACPNSWQTYRNDTYGFEFNYPNSLTFSSPSSSARNVFTIDSRTTNRSSDKSKPFVGLFISRFSGSGEEKLKEEKNLWVNQSKIQETKIGESHALITSTIIEVVSDTGGEVNRAAQVTLSTYKNNYFYSFQCVQNGSNYDECNRIISTFKFTNPSLEKQIGLVQKIYQKNGKYYLDIDYIQLVTDETTCRARGIGFYGFCVINDNSLIRTFEINSNASIKTTTKITADGKISGGVDAVGKSTTLAILMKAFNDPSNVGDNQKIISLFNINIDSSGKVVDLSEQYRP